MYFEEICNPLKKKRTLSTDTFYDLNDIKEINEDNDINNSDINNNDINNILNSINNLNINNNEELFKNITKKINSLEKKFDIIDKLNIKIDKLEKSINNILIEKDYVIDTLRDNINDLTTEIKELKYKNYENIKNENNYFC